MPPQLGIELKRIFDGGIPKPPLTIGKVVATILGRYFATDRCAEHERYIVETIRSIGRLELRLFNSTDEEAKRRAEENLSWREYRLVELLIDGRELWSRRKRFERRWISYCFSCVSTEEAFVVSSADSHSRSLERHFFFPNALMRALKFFNRDNVSALEQFEQCDELDLRARVGVFRDELQVTIPRRIERLEITSIDEFLEKHEQSRLAAKREHGRALAKCGDAKWIETLNAIALLNEDAGVFDDFSVDEEKELGLNPDQRAYDLYQSGMSWSEVRDRINDEMKGSSWEEWTSDSSPRKAAKRWLEFNPQLVPLRESRGRRKRKTGTDG